MKQKHSAPTRSLTGRLFAHAALGAYFAILFVGGLLHGDKMSVIAPNYIIYFNPLIYAAVWLVLTGILLAYGVVSKHLVYGFSWIATCLYAVFAAVSGGSYFLTFAMCGLVAVMTYACGRALGELPAGQKPATALSPTGGKVTVAVVAAMMGGAVLFLLASSLISHTTSPSASTAVYVQLLASLKEGFSFETTLEFGEAVSHWAAHVSPIFLVYLPFYALIPSPVTPVVLQTAVVYSAVIPLWLIARRKGLSPRLSAVLCLLLCLFPAVWSGTAGSFHEYALLLPLLLWLIWALESRRTGLVILFAALVLCVRETCAIHLFTVALYHLIVNRKATEEDGHSRRGERVKALILMGVALVYLIVTLVLLTYAGKGTLITRFENVTGKYATDFGTLIREIIFNPAIALYEMLIDAKLHYLLCLLLPLGLLPLFTRKKAGLVFLLPLLLLNLLSDFAFHYNLDYPYSFGVSAFALFLCAEALAELSAKAHKETLVKRLTTLAVCFTLIIGAVRVVEVIPFAAYPLEKGAEITAMNELLDTVDEDASVSASGRLLPSLAAREEIYSLSAKATTEYVVLDLREDWAIPSEETYNVDYYEKLGYTVVAKENGVGVVLQKK